MDIQNGTAEEAPFVSIILLCYNYARYLPKSLEMILAQTFKDFEVVFVNNGSTDDSGRVAADFFAAHPEIRHTICTIEKNDFVLPALRAGSAAAKGTYIMFHDGDDYMDTDTLEKLVNKAKENDADRVVGGVRTVGEDGKVYRENTLSKRTIPLRNQILHANIFRRSIFMENHVVDQIENFFGFDMMITFTFSKYIRNFGHVDEPCYNYVYKKQSITGGINFYEEMDNPKFSFKVWIDYLKRMYDEETDAETKEWLEYMAVQCLWEHLGRTCRCAPSGPKCSEVYEKYRAILVGSFPNYRKNRKISLFRTPEATFHNRILVWFLFTLEKAHLLVPLLRLWNFISRRKYIAMV